jgi:hypothetical protein
MFFRNVGDLPGHTVVYIKDSFHHSHRCKILQNSPTWLWNQRQDILSVDMSEVKGFVEARSSDKGLQMNLTHSSFHATYVRAYTNSVIPVRHFYSLVMLKSDADTCGKVQTFLCVLCTKCVK